MKFMKLGSKPDAFQAHHGNSLRKGKLKAIESEVVLPWDPC
ncbi:hypothetical protein Lalb_Chr24g0401981 [Lupinus albus]|uniref:Uncharacterized protein n=1 Tax=Lupinus albus TaxID=3870 RepID=A0A6A4N4Z3_LUPAL|nr:hypothetical protein Lalb_Chr24g0401981 [Lupinus albus]